MKKTSINQILAATGGTLVGKGKSNYITGVKHDSRECGQGDMFVAIVGPNQDGHKFIAQVVNAGCDAILVSNLYKSPLGLSDVNIILVDDTVEAMGDLASWYLNALNIRRVAVTGSVGKTSTRDMIYYVLKQKYQCGRNLKNYNNNIGLPISIFAFDETIEAAVLEMGMDAFGEIEYLSGIVKPEIGVITNIGVAHMEKLGSREGIFKAKMEIAGNIEPKEKGGTLIIAGDDDFLTKERTKGDYSQIEIGYDKNCDYMISDIDDFGVEGIQFSLVYLEEKTTVRLPVPGVHNAINASIAIAVGGAFGLGMDEAIKGLEQASLTGSRLKMVKGKTVRIIDDTYNANPASMISALDVMMKSEAVRHVAILADMFELGDNTEELHRSVGIHARDIGIDQVITIGKLSENISRGAESSEEDGKTGSIHFASKEEFFEQLTKLIKPGDLILVKASRAMKMEEVVAKLEQL